MPMSNLSDSLHLFVTMTDVSDSLYFFPIAVDLQLCARELATLDDLDL